MRWIFRSALAAVVVTALVAVGVPVWLIQPFAPQTPRGLAWSHSLKQIAPALTAVMLAMSIALAATLWRDHPVRSGDGRVWRTLLRRSTFVVLVIVVEATTWFSRQNHFDWMFRPNGEPTFVAASDAADVEAGEPVIGVAVATDAIAFPVTRLGYHHVINTTIGRQPIVGTY